MKTYLLQFGSGNPASFTGLTPTLTLFKGILPSFGITTPTIAAPGVTEIPASGVYAFQYEPQASMAIAFICDGGASLSDSQRYIVGILDPVQAVDEKIGFSTDSFGTTATDPSTLFGYSKRSQEVSEGNGSFDSSTNLWTISSRGSSTTLATKTLSNSNGTITKA